MSMRVTSSPFWKRKVSSPPFEHLLFVSSDVCTRDADQVLQTYPEDIAVSLFIDILHIVDKYKQAFKTLSNQTTCPRCGYPDVEEAP